MRNIALDKANDVQFSVDIIAVHLDCAMSRIATNERTRNKDRTSQASVRDGLTEQNSEAVRCDVAR